MEPRYLLDTNICIYIRQKRPQKVLQHFDKLEPGEAGISIITYGELIYGAAKSKHSLAMLERLRELTTELPPWHCLRVLLSTMERFDQSWKPAAK